MIQGSEKRTVSFNLTHEILDRMDQLAEQQDRTRSSLARVLLREKLSEIKIEEEQKSRSQLR